MMMSLQKENDSLKAELTDLKRPTAPWRGAYYRNSTHTINRSSLLSSQGQSFHANDERLEALGKVCISFRQVEHFHGGKKRRPAKKRARINSMCNKLPRCMYDVACVEKTSDLLKANVSDSQLDYHIVVLN